MTQQLNSGSGYSPQAFNEQNRLKQQEKMRRCFSNKLFKDSLMKIGKGKEIIGIDLGCANGYVTEKRFNTFSEYFSRVIGIDRSQSAIKQAKKSMENLPGIFIALI
jgi:trans-aconitate methyltransferase